MLFLLILIISLILQFFLPWWIIALVAFGMSFWKAQTAGRAFGSGFAAIFLLWVIMGLIYSIPNENLLANRIAEMLTLPASSFGWIVILLVSGIVGGLAAGLSALAGFYSRGALLNSAPAKENTNRI
ncbi:MAG TPA: hypothetical protein VLZ28_00020 [Daejeonella sp.]|nr:hypothetical protein [Daejeonella sp.]